MRLFIAICFPDNMKRALNRVIRKLRDEGVTGNFTRDMNMHLTLAFLGEVEAHDLPRIQEAMEDVQFSPFEIQLEGSGMFRDLLWVGTRPSPQLTAVTEDLRRSLTENGIWYDPKPFQPHITLLRRARNLEGVPVKVQGESFTADRISLMLSERIDGRLTYTELSAVSAEGKGE